MLLMTQYCGKLRLKIAPKNAIMYTRLLEEISGTNNKQMTFTDVKSGLVSGIIAAVLAVALLVIQNGSVFNLDWHVIVNVAVIAFLASIVKVLGTSAQGTFLGAKIK
jgi:hypothetical protein